MAPVESEKKLGTARADRIRAERRQLVEETRKAIDDLRNSLPDEWTDINERPTSPNITVNVQPRRSWIDSLRPRRPRAPESTFGNERDESVLPKRSTKARNVAGITAIVAAIVAGVISALKSAGILH